VAEPGDGLPVELRVEETAVLEVAVLTVFPAAVVFAGAMDLFTMTIPNRISLAMVVGFVVLAPLAGLGLGDMAYHAGAGLFVLAVGVLLFIPGWIGGGDAKLAAVISLWLGAEHILPYVLATSIFGGVLTLTVLRFRSMPMPAFCLSMPCVVQLHEPKNGVPYGIAIAVAALVIFPNTPWMAVLS
jgi:prepilin peptidase CpaA